MENTQLKPLSRWWLIVGVAALAVAGLYAAPLAFMRSPAVKASPELTRLFKDALVVHVDLSVMVWFLAVACLLWSLMSRQVRPLVPYMEESALIAFALGALAIALSPFDPGAAPLMSNYIPVIHSPVFFFGLALIGCAVAMMLARFLHAFPHRKESRALETLDARLQGKGKLLGLAIFSAAIITLISLAAFIYSTAHIPSGLDLETRYELSFWAGGHILQFTHTQLLMVAWLMLAGALHTSPSLPRRERGWLVYTLFAIGLLAVLASPLGYLHPVDSGEHRQFFTNQMILAGGIAPSLLGIYIAVRLWRARAHKNALWSALAMSVLLFLYGGLLGGLISGQNVSIPAHYHGSIVGVTLGFMGLAYFLLPSLGYRDVACWRLAFWQPIVYGIGQIMHVSGLAYSGGYGVLRKTPGGMENLPLDVKAAMGFMGMGGLLAIIGGLMFVLVAYKAMRAKA